MDHAAELDPENKIYAIRVHWFRVFKWTSMPTLDTRTPRPSVKRQQRGIDRIEELLRAAELTFAENGYERATTIQIAERAQVSVGTLYQFFKKKQDFAEEIARRYAARLREIKKKIPAELIDLPLQVQIERVVDPFLSFHQESPAFATLFSESSISQELREQTRPMHIAIVDSLSILLKQSLRNRTETELRLTAEVCTTIFRAFLPLINSAPRKRTALVQELKTVIFRYLQPLV